MMVVFTLVQTIEIFILLISRVNCAGFTQLTELLIPHQLSIISVVYGLEVLMVICTQYNQMEIIISPQIQGLEYILIPQYMEMLQSLWGTMQAE